MEWNEKQTVKKGNIGEELIIKYLKDMGFMLAKWIDSGGHPFDRFAYNKTTKEIIIIEIKTKGRRFYYPDTGIDITKYELYKEIEKKNKINIFIIFVDHLIGEIYGNFLDVLDKPEGKYPLVQGDIIYFQLNKMKKIATLDLTTKLQLISLTTTNFVD